MKCFRCGAKVADQLHYCGHCGARLSDPHSPTMLVERPEGDTLLHRVSTVLAPEYDVERELARGGMGVVFQGRETALGRAVALKVLSPDLAPNVRAVERFKREARMVADLDHPNIVPMYRVGQAGDLLFIAMKYIEGRPLGKLIEAQGALPMPVVIGVLRAAGAALAYAHDRGIVHRDVKGDNILLDSDGRVLMGDFGVALRAADVNLTVDGTMIGTPAFMSPEQCAGKRATPQSDQYSLGVVAFQMLAGTVPFSSETIAGYIQHHIATPIPDIRPVRDDMPSALVPVVNRMLEKEAGDRYRSTDEMLEAIETIPFSDDDRRDSQDMLRQLVLGTDVARVSTRFTPPVLGTKTQVLSRTRKGRRMAMTAAGAAAALLAAIVWNLSRPATGDPPPTTRSDPSLAAQGADGATGDASGATPTPDPRRAPPVASGRLRLLTSPPDANIFVDGRHVGVGSIFDLAVTEGRLRIQAQAVGYVPFDTLVTVPANGLVNLGRVTLQPRGQRP